MKWFKHDSDASNDPKIKKLKKKFGMAGYGVYFNLLEIIARKMEDHIEDFGFIPNDWDDELFSIEFDIDTNTLRTMFSYMCELGLFENKSGRLYNSKIQGRCDDYTARILRNKPNLTESTNTVRIKSDFVPLEEKRIEEKKESNASVVPPHPKKKPTSEKGWANLRRAELGKPPLKKPMTAAQKRAMAELLKIQPFIDLYRELAAEKGLSYLDFPEELNQKIRRQFLNTMAAFGENTEDFIRWIFTGNHPWAIKTQYNPESCMASFMFADYKNKGVELKTPETLEDIARRLLIAARKRGTPDNDETEYRMWARNGFAKERGISDKDLQDNEEFKQVQHIIGY